MSYLHHYSSKSTSAIIMEEDDDDKSRFSSSSHQLQQQQQVPVDLTLASTYVPAILCLLRASFLIVIMSRDWTTHNMPALIIIGIMLYVDRVVRQEIIFDSSALTCTIYAVHVLNLCRSRIAHIDAPLLDVQWPLLNNVTHASSQQQQQIVMAAWQHHLAMVAYSVASVLLLMDVDIASLAWPSKGKYGGGRHHHNNQHLHGDESCSCLTILANGTDLLHDTQDSDSSSCSATNGMRVSTIVLHCILVGLIMQVAVSQDVFMVPWKVMLRSFFFAFLSIFWTYAVGIHNSCLQIRTYPYYYNPVLQKKYVQPFTPCQLRFLVILLIDGWLLAATCACMAGITIRQISSIIASTNIILPSASSPAMIVSTAKSRGADSVAVVHDLIPQVPHQQTQQQQQPHIQMHASSGGVAVVADGNSNNDVVMMFRLAQKAAASQRLGGEQI